MKFRGHHLICLHFYRGEGYDREYVEKLSILMEKAAAGEIVEIVAGADDVCHFCPHLRHEQCKHQANSEQEIKELDQRALTHLGLKCGDQVIWRRLAQFVDKTPANWFQDFCQGCDWLELCNRIKASKK